MSDYTVKQVAERIARAVLKQVDADGTFLAPHDSYFDPAWSEDGFGGPDLAGDVLDVLHETGTVLCQLVENEQGVSVEVPLPFDAPVSERTG